ncbi:MAG: hypothetical protein IRZ14_18695 [Chloroflexi bacterium]|nr:hypothetical protein [Chloroflexota bacterium]
MQAETARRGAVLPPIEQVEAQLGEILAGLAARPAVAFHEQAVARFASDWLVARGVSVEPDEYGNLLARVGGGEGPPLVLVAHLDHPGVHLTRDGRATLAGGVAASALQGRVPVRLLGPRGEQRAWLDGYDEHTRQFARIEPPPPRGAAFAVWDLPDFAADDARWTMRAADDLVGVAAILWTLTHAPRRRRPLIGVLTRAEEIGLIGATLVAQAGTLPADALVVSLEASRELPGARIGDGPVIRVGDRSAAFHPAGEALLVQAAGRLTERAPGFRFQRQLMTGGTCEATVFTAFGYQTGALAIPLGNYHNVDAEGRLAAEYVAPRDLAWLVLLLLEVARPTTVGPLDALRQRLVRRARASARRLRARRDTGLGTHT